MLRVPCLASVVCVVLKLLLYVTGLLSSCYLRVCLTLRLINTSDADRDLYVITNFGCLH